MTLPALEKVLLITAAVASSVSIHTHALPDQHMHSKARDEAHPCPFSRSLGEGNENATKKAREQANARIKAWESAYPMDGERKYKVGQANEGEAFCSSNDDNRYCNHVHGAWGDAIPQTREYCIWAILEFQDPPEFGFTPGNPNFNMFNDQGGLVMSSVAERTPADAWKVLAMTGGEPNFEPKSSPWPVASMVWEAGNLHGKKWINDYHRKTQSMGLEDWNWAFHGHYKAVKCDDIWPTLEKNGLTQKDNFFGSAEETDGGEEMELKLEENKMLADTGTNFVKFWNAFSDMKDESPVFYSDTCSLGPCPGDGSPVAPSAAPSAAPVTPSAATNIAVSWIMTAVVAVQTASIVW